MIQSVLEITNHLFYRKSFCDTLLRCILLNGKFTLFIPKFLESQMMSLTRRNLLFRSFSIQITILIDGTGKHFVVKQKTTFLFNNVSNSLHLEIKMLKSLSFVFVFRNVIGYPLVGLNKIRALSI